MNAIQKCIQKKRFEKYLKLKQEFGCIEQPKVYVVERDIKKLIADRGVRYFLFTGKRMV